MSTEKIQDAIRSANLTQVNLEGKEIWIKNQSEDAFTDILKALELEDIPTYSQKDKRRTAYIQPK